MVTFAVLGHRGMLGSTVERRWQEHGAEPVNVCVANVIVNCVYPDNWPLLQSLPLQRVIQPSTDAIHEQDAYAVTKREVEAIVRPSGLVIRTGLVDLRKQPERAFTNWIGNPLTPLEWADLAWGRREWRGLWADGREPISRYGVALAVAEVFGVEPPVAALAPSTRYRVMPRSSDWPPLREALAAYREWLG